MDKIDKVTYCDHCGKLTRTYIMGDVSGQCCVDCIVAEYVRQMEWHQNKVYYYMDEILFIRNISKGV
jgi:hypothetical protein